MLSLRSYLDVVCSEAWRDVFSIDVATPLRFSVSVAYNGWVVHCVLVPALKHWLMLATHPSPIPIPTLHPACVAMDVEVGVRVCNATPPPHPTPHTHSISDLHPPV